jgi:hypothetical protein
MHPPISFSSGASISVAGNPDEAASLEEGGSRSSLIEGSRCPMPGGSPAQCAGQQSGLLAGDRILESSVARSVGVVSAAWRGVSTISTIGSNGSSSADAYRHATAYGCATIDTSPIDNAPMDATAIGARATNAAAIGEGVI